jgi:hypothetical protein
MTAILPKPEKKGLLAETLGEERVVTLASLLKMRLSGFVS